VYLRHAHSHRPIKLNRKKNAPYLYDLVITHALDWPSLTCQWFPDKESYVFLLFSLDPPNSLEITDQPANPTQSTVSCSARIPQAKLKITSKSPPSKSPSVPVLALTNSTGTPTTTTAVN